VALKEVEHFVIVQNNHIAGTGFIPVNDRIHREKMVFWFLKYHISKLKIKTCNIYECNH